MRRLPRVTEEEFEFFRQLVHQRFGIDLSSGQEHFLARRLQPLMERSGSRTPLEFAELLRSDLSGVWVSELANAVTTQHTGFFREPEHFTFLRGTALPELTERKRADGELDLRIWSAACATGAEPYSIILTLMAFLGAEYERWDAGALATDISDAALAKARLGRYPRQLFDAVPVEFRRHFTPYDEGAWELAEDVRREVTFRRFNLLETVLPFRRPFDVIFCRNVTIYFDQATRDALIARLYGATAPGGYLFIGHSETLDRDHSRYEYVKPSVYRRQL